MNQKLEAYHANLSSDDSGWVRHLIEETKRLGDVIVDEGKESRARHEATQRQIAELDKAQSLTDRDLKIFIAKVSGGVSAVVALGMWVVKSGVLAVFL